jgi:hypothetical protein
MRTMIVCGGVGVMVDEFMSLRRVTEMWLDVEDAVHDFFAIPGFAKPLELAFEAIVQWVEGAQVSSLAP